jgi:nitric oxide reductase NorD protein
MASQQLPRVAIEALLDVWLETEFTFHDAGPVARALSKLERAQQDFVLDWIKRIATTHITLAFHFAKRAPDLIRRLDARAIEAWAVQLCDTYDRAGMYAALSVAEQADAYSRTRQSHTEGALYDDIAGVLGNFVHGLSGRKLRIEQGEAIYTDSEKIVLPAITSLLASRDDNFKLAKARVALLWAQTRFGTLRVDIAAACAGYPHPDRALHQFNALETLRLTACIRRELPGLHREMQRLSRLIGDEVPAPWQALADRLASEDAGVEDSLGLLDAAYRLADFPAWCYRVELRPDVVAAARAARLEKEKARLRIKLAEMLQEHEAAQRDDAMESRNGKAEFEVTPRDENGALDFEITLDDIPIAPPDDVRQLLTSVYLDFGAIPPEYLTPAGEGEYDPNLVFDRPEDPDAVWQGTYHEKGAELYPEWDHGRQHYRKNWCVMREKSVPPVHDDFVQQTLDKHAGLVRHLRRKFEALRDENRFEKRQQQGDEIDIDALVEALADARDGREMSDRLFVRQHRAERNIAVAFLVDMSGSTKGWINEAEREALVLLCEALELLGDRYAIYGFSGTTRKRCELFRIKTFDDRYDDAVKARIAGIRPQEYTRMGFALRHMTKLLNQVEARTRVLVTLSDGRPDDYFDVYRGQYGVEDTRMALLEASRTGIHPFCITLDREARDYLPHMYGAARYVIVDDVRQLPLKVNDIYRRITT